MNRSKCDSGAFNQGTIRNGIAILLLLCLLGCSTPRLDGPNISKPPEGFMFDANASSARTVFPEEYIKRQFGWAKPSEENYCSIMMTEFSGSVTRTDVQAAKDYLEKRYNVPQEYSALEVVTIDKREAWGWLETQYYKGELTSLEYVAVISYEDCCYSIGFYAKDPAFRDLEILREIVCSFRKGD